MKQLITLIFLILMVFSAQSQQNYFIKKFDYFIESHRNMIANPSLYLPMALAITFPFNITLGMPLYMYIVQNF